MNLTHFDRGLGDLEVMADFRGRRLHLVCVAVNALTFYNAFAVGDSITHERAGELASVVNEKNETGTLWPQLPMTIVPLSVYGGRNDFGNRTIMSRHIDDAIKANELYIKCSDLVFALERRFDFDEPLACDILREKLRQSPAMVYTQRVYYIS